MSGDTNGNGKLDPGEHWMYTATGIAPAGLFANVALAERSPDDGATTVYDDDLAYAFGVVAKIDDRQGRRCARPAAPDVDRAARRRLA